MHQSKNEDEMQKLIDLYCPDGELLFGGDADSAPLRYLSAEGGYEGFTIDYLTLISLEMGININTTYFDKWKDALEACRIGETDLIDIYESDERKDKYALSDPLYTMRAIIAVKNDSEFSNRDVINMQIGALDGDFAVDFLEANYSGIRIVPLNNLIEGLRLLETGEIDGLIGDEPILMYYINKYGYTSKVGILDDEIYETNMVLALPKAKAGLLPAVNEAIKKVNNGEQIEKIQQKWFGLSTSLIIDKREKTIRLILYVFLLIGMGLAILYVYSRQLKMQVSERTLELESSRNELQLVLKQIPEKVIVINRNGIILNDEYSYSKYDALEVDNNTECFCLVNKICDEEKCIHTGNEVPPRCMLKRLITENGIITKKFSAGNYMYQATMVPFYTKKGSNDEILVTVRDITLDEINSRKLAQSSKMIAVGQLAAGMAHQIRNPLGIIRTQSFLIRKKDLGEAINESLNYVDESADSIGKIVDNVLDYWRLSGNEYEDVNMLSFVNKIIYLHGEKLRKKNIAVNISIDETLAVYMIKESLNHILTNIISNAIDAMNDGGKLGIACEKNNDWTVIKCTDTGCGMSDEEMENLFNPFFTTKKNNEGTGLGMFVAYAECEKIGGKLEVKSETDRGTMITVYIPIIKKEVLDESISNR